MNEWHEQYGELHCPLCGAMFDSEILYMNKKPYEANDWWMNYCPCCGGHLNAPNDQKGEKNG